MVQNQQGRSDISIEIYETKNFKFAMITATLNAWASAIGCDQQTLERSLAKYGHDWKRGDRISANVVFKAHFGNPKDRLAAAQAEAVEAKNRERDEITAEWEQFETLTNQLFVSPLIAALDAAPSKVDREWVESVVKPILRSELRKKKTK